VGNDPALLMTRNLLLERLGYRVHAAHGLSAALKCFDEESGDFDLVVLCHSIPENRRQAAARWIRRRRPTTKILLLSYFPEESKARQDVYVSHPYPDALLLTISRLSVVESAALRS
jgi:CheY-like chemotaxis protein